MHIEANDLLMFARVADCGSFSRAAEQLGLPKSTLSRRLFIRIGKPTWRTLIAAYHPQTVVD